MNDERVFQLLAETNPVPDVDNVPAAVALHELSKGGPIMAVDTRPPMTLEDTSASRGRRRGPLVAAAAALAVVVAGAALWATTGGDDDVISHPGMASVEAAYEAMNEGNVAGFYRQLTERAVEADDHERRSLDAGLNRQTELRSPCRLLEPSPTTGLDRIQCDVNVTNDFFRAGGITTRYEDTFVIADDGRIDVLLYRIEDRRPADAFSQAFWGWLTATYPEVYDSIWPVSPLMLPTFDHPEETPIALEYMDEFLDQSSEYPLPPSN